MKESLELFRVDGLGEVDGAGVLVSLEAALVEGGSLEVEEEDGWSLGESSGAAGGVVVSAAVARAVGNIFDEGSEDVGEVDGEVEGEGKWDGEETLWLDVADERTSSLAAALVDFEGEEVGVGKGGEVWKEVGEGGRELGERGGWRLAGVGLADSGSGGEGDGVDEVAEELFRVLLATLEEVAKSGHFSSQTDLQKESRMCLGLGEAW